jgi:hypothetical protein
MSVPLPPTSRSLPLLSARVSLPSPPMSASALRPLQPADPKGARYFWAGWAGARVGPVFLDLARRGH